MSDALQAALKIAGSGMEVQSTRLRVISENVANAESTGAAPGANPYTRKTISFDNVMDRVSGIQTVRVKRIGLDDQPYRVELEPGNPAADEKGFVKYPNVNLLVELADMREANRSYEANLQVVKQSGDLTSMTIGLLKD